MESNLNIICLESEAFYTLVEKVLDRIEASRKEQPKWIDDDEAMAIMNVRSKTTLQKLRDEGKIRFSQLGRKMILYDRESIFEYIESKAKDTF
jgi:hypothetical protein